MVQISSPFILQIFVLISFPQFSLIAHTFPSLSPYPHGDTEAFLFVVPYDNIYDISDYFQPHIISRKVLHHIGRMICDPHHNFAVIQGTNYVNDCPIFCTLWEGVCKDIFSILYHSLLEVRSIQIILLLRQMIRYKESLLFLLADSTL